MSVPPHQLPKRLHVVYSIQVEGDSTAQRAFMSENGADWFVGIISHQFPNNPPEIETQFTIAEVERLSAGILAGNREALHTKGLARKLASYCLLKLNDEDYLKLQPLPEQQTSVIAPDGCV